MRKDGDALSSADTGSDTDSSARGLIEGVVSVVNLGLLGSSVRLDSQLHLFLIHCDPLFLKKRKIDSKKLFCSATPTLAHVSNQANQTACEENCMLSFFPYAEQGPSPLKALG